MEDRQVALSRARRELATLTRWVQRHQGRVVITRKGKACAMLVPTGKASHYTLSTTPVGDEVLVT
ncbi:MAG: hypothetical protein HYV16_02080 [Gammaproteobacteria bacterium]|nr:hypothetical protein [Gammaproteobacteria bacterium]